MDIVEITSAEHIKAAHDSVDVINSIISVGVKDADTASFLARNAEHLEIICGKDYAADFASDVAVFQSAIKAAQSTLPSNSSTPQAGA